jgi:hypothetical protein
MSIVCGYRPPGSDRVWLSSDSRSCGGDFIYPAVSRKIVRAAGWLIGMSGPDLVHEMVGRLDQTPWPAATVRDRIWSWAKDAGWGTSHRDDPGPLCYPMALILARPGELLGIAPDGSIWSPEDGFVAIGSGQDFAYGAFFADGTIGAEPDSLLRCAVLAAINYRSDCGGEVVVESIG